MAYISYNLFIYPIHFLFSFLPILYFVFIARIFKHFIFYSFSSN